MGCPVRLMFQWPRVIPRWATRPQDSECTFHGPRYLPLSTTSPAPELRKPHVRQTERPATTCRRALRRALARAHPRRLRRLGRQAPSPSRFPLTATRGSSIGTTRPSCSAMTWHSRSDSMTDDHLQYLDIRPHVSRTAEPRMLFLRRAARCVGYSARAPRHAPPQRVLPGRQSETATPTTASLRMRLA